MQVYHRMKFTGERKLCVQDRVLPSLCRWERLGHSLALYAWTAQNYHSCSERMIPDRERQTLSTWRVIQGPEKLCTVQMGPDVIFLIFFLVFVFSIRVRDYLGYKV